MQITAPINFNPEPLVWQGDRVFVSPAFGCPASCVFCYLGSFEGAKPKGGAVKGQELWDAITLSSRFSPGAEGTLLSVGCLSEALAPHAIESTLRFFESAMGSKNPVQLATRWAPEGILCERLLNVCTKLQIAIFHSFTCLEKRASFERGTPSTEKRKKFMAQIAQNGIPQVLYLKPLLPGVTIIEVNELGDLAEEFGIKSVVVGPLYADPRITEALKQKGIDASRASLLEQMPLAGFPKLTRCADEEQSVIQSFMARNFQVFRHAAQASRYITSLTQK